MSKDKNQKLEELLSEEVSRHNNILSYKLEEGSQYKFYEAEEDEEVIEPEEEEVVDDTMSDELGSDAEEEELVNDETPEKGDIEVDVTDLVNSNKEMNAKTDDIVRKMTDTESKMASVSDKISDVEKSLSKMDLLIQQMVKLANQVELMRPQTEKERREALAKDSYPFSVTQDEYVEGMGPMTQTDLESKPDKLTMMDNLVNDYNETDIKHSFYNVEDKEEKKVSNY